MKISSRAFLILAITLVSHSRADNLLSTNLIQQQKFLRESHTIDQLLEMEKLELAKLTAAESNSNREAISREQAQKLLNSISPHPVVGQTAYDFYNRAGREIGYCFGRATYVHLALLKMGVKKDAIKKIWTVGLTGGSVNWIYHVATAVRTTDGNWTVIDNFVGRLITAQDWATDMRTMTVDGKKATFITDAKKFHPSTGTYSRIELGIGMSREADFYKNYFGDLFKWFGSTESNRYLAAYGVKHVSGSALKCRQLRFSDVFRRSI